MLAVPVLSAAGWFGFFYAIYGTFNPGAPYGGLYQPRPWFVNALVGLLGDEQFGLMTYAPALAVVFVGWRRRTPVFDRRLAVELGIVTLSYLVGVSLYWMWWAGVPATPARFATAVLPVLSVPAAVAWSRASARGRAVCLGLLAVTAAITALVMTVDATTLALNARDAEARWLEWLGPVVNLPRAWPSFFWFPDHEGRFTLQLAVWAGCFGLIWLLVREIWPRESDSRLAVAWWLVGGTMLAAQSAWWTGRAKPLDPSWAQVAVLEAEAAGRHHVELGALRVERTARLVAGMEIGSSEPGETDEPPPLLLLRDLPAGEYQLHVTMRLLRREAMTLTVGRSPAPLRTYALRPVGDQEFHLELPAPVSALVVDGNETARRAISSVTVRPGILAHGSSGVSSEAMHYGTVDVFFLGGTAYLAPTGFWVGGRDSAQMALVVGHGRAAAHLRIVNGAVENVVTVEAGVFQRAIELAPGEATELDVPAGAGDGVVRIASGDGFQPSAVDKSSTDRRLLGVWVQIQ